MPPANVIFKEISAQNIVSHFYPSHYMWKKHIYFAFNDKKISRMYKNSYKFYLNFSHYCCII